MRLSSGRETAVKALERRGLARRIGRSTTKNVNFKREEIAADYTKAKTTHPDFPAGQRFGYAAAILKSAKYRKLHNDLPGKPT